MVAEGRVGKHAMIGGVSEIASGASEVLCMCAFIVVSSVDVAQEVVHLWAWFRYTSSTRHHRLPIWKRV